MKKIILAILLMSQTTFAITGMDAKQLSNEGLQIQAAPLMDRAEKTIKTAASLGKFDICVDAKGFPWDVRQYVEKSLHRQGYLTDWYWPDCLYLIWR